MVNGPMPKGIARMVCKSLGNLLGIRSEVSIAFLDSSYGAAVAGLEPVQLREYIAFANAGAEVSIIFFDLLLSTL